MSITNQEEDDEEDDEERLRVLMHQFEIESSRPGYLKLTQEWNEGFNQDYTLSSTDREKIIDKMLEFAQNEREIYSWPLFPDELERAIQKFRSSGCHNSLKKQ